MAASILILVPVMALTAIPAHPEALAITRDAQRYALSHAQAVSEFTATVNRYVEIHRLLENPMASLTRGADLEQTARARAKHREAIVEARIATSRGDIFTPNVAADLRRQLEMATYRAWMTEADPMEAAFERLPQLPQELEYRFVDRDLVLMDTEIDLVVDVLQNALPADPVVDGTHIQEPRERQELCAPDEPPVVTGSPCEAHPELEMCWS